MGVTLAMMAVFYGIRVIAFVPSNWATFVLLCGVAGIAGCIMNFFILLNGAERKILTNKILAKVRK